MKLVIAQPPQRRHQNGAALVIALVFLIALTLLGLAATGGNTLQQKMAYSVGESNLAFQSAESALIAGELWLDQRTTQPAPDCVSPCGDTTSIWPARPPAGNPEVNLTNLRNPTWWTNQGRQFGVTYTDGASPVAIPGQVLPRVDDTPRYVIEELGKDPSGSLVVGGPKVFTLWYYQITGRGTGVLPGGPHLMVQSVYSKGF